MLLDSCCGVLYQGFRVSGFQGFRVSGFQGSTVPGFQGSRVSEFQGFRVSGFQGFRVPGFQGFRVSRFFRAVVNVSGTCCPPTSVTTPARTNKYAIRSGMTNSVLSTRISSRIEVKP